MNNTIKTKSRASYHKFVRKPILRLIPPVLQKIPISSMVIGPPKGLVSSTKDWAVRYSSDKKHLPAKYSKVHDQQHIRRHSPKTVHPEIDPVFRKLETEINETFVVSIPLGRAFKFDGAIVTPDDYLLEDLSPEFDCERYIPERHTVMSQMYLPKMSLFPGKVAALMTLGQSCFGHWMMDLLPRVESLKQAGYSLDDFDWFYIDECKHSYQVETLARVGIPIAKVINPSKHPQIRADELVVPSYVGGCFNASGQTCDFLEQLFSKEQDTPLSEKPLRLYISRSNTQHRRLLNESQIVKLLMSYGFVVVEPQKMMLAEQARLFKRAEVIVASLGSAVANYVHCKPNTKIIEFFNPKCVQTCTWNVCYQKHFDYYYFLASDESSKDHAINEDIWISPELLAKTLALAEVSPC